MACDTALGSAEASRVPAEALHKRAWLVIHFSMRRGTSWGPTGKLCVVKPKFFCFCHFYEHSEGHVVSATPKLSSWDNYL